MTEPYDEDDAPRKAGVGSTMQLLQYRLDSVERELRSLRTQQDRRFKEVAEDYQKRVKDVADESEKRIKEVEANFDKRIGRIESFLLR